MLNTGAHVSFIVDNVDEYQFYLDESQDRPYQYFTSETRGGDFSLLGAPNLLQPDPRFRVWLWDDWSGGESGDVYFPDEPNKYFQSTAGVNPRVPGQLTGRPTVATSSLTVDTTGYGTHFDVGAGRAWIVQGLEANRSTDTETWTNTANTGLGVGYKASAVVGDAAHLYIAGSNSSGKSATGNRIIRRIDDAGTLDTVVADHSGFRRYFGLARLNEFLYAWNGRKLEAFDLVNETLPITRSAVHKVMDEGPDNIPADNLFWADLKAGETAVYAMHSVPGRTTVYEYKRFDSPPVGAGRVLWTLPKGFTGKALEVANGVVFVSGNYDDATSGEKGIGALFGLSLATFRRGLLAVFRPDTDTLFMQEMRQGLGNTLILGTRAALFAFIYDMETGAVSLLDKLAATTTLLAVGTYKSRRVVVTDTAAAQVRSYKTDDDGDTQTGSGGDFDVLSGIYDFDMPFEKKTLFGITVVYKPITAANTTIEVQYQKDESGTWVSAGTINSASTGASAGRTFLAVSTKTSTVDFRVLRLRFKGSATASAVQPIVYKVAAWALPGGAPGSHIEGWRLALRIVDDKTFPRKGTPTKASALARVTQEASAAEILYTLNRIFKQNKLVVFRDGYGWPHPGQYQAYDPVTVRIIESSLGPNSDGIIEGTMVVEVQRMDRSANDEPSTTVPAPSIL